MSHLAYSILLAQLIITLINYQCTVALPGLADWSAFLRQASLTMPCEVTIETIAKIRHGRHLLDTLGLSGPMTIALLGLIDTQNSPIGRYNLPLAAYPPHPLPPARPPLIRAIHDITVVAQNPAVLASY